MRYKKFWNFQTDPVTQENVMRLEGEIASEKSWYGDVVTPAAFRAELAAHPGDLTIWINSPGGDVFAASDIYTALMEHDGTLTVKVSGIAASAASIIAMAACRTGDQILMAPTSYMMVHNPWSVAIGDSADMAHMSEVLNEIREGQVGAYAKKTGKSRAEIIALLDAETYMNAASAVDAGFADAILFEPSVGEGPKACVSSRAAIYAMARDAVQVSSSGSVQTVSNGGSLFTVSGGGSCTATSSNGGGTTLQGTCGHSHSIGSGHSHTVFEHTHPASSQTAAQLAEEQARADILARVSLLTAGI